MKNIKNTLSKIKYTNQIISQIVDNTNTMKFPKYDDSEISLDIVTEDYQATSELTLFKNIDKTTKDYIRDLACVNKDCFIFVSCLPDSDFFHAIIPERNYLYFELMCEVSYSNNDSYNIYIREFSSMYELYNSLNEYVKKELLKNIN